MITAIMLKSCRAIVCGGLLLSLLGAAATQPSTSPAARILADYGKLAKADWSAGEGITVAPAEGKLTFKCDADGGWATVEQQTEVSPAAKIRIDVGQVKGGNLIVQGEWFDAAGDFISADEIVKTGEPAQFSKTIKEIVGDKPMPAKMRLKFWLEGKGCEATVDQARVVQETVWRTPGVESGQCLNLADVQADTGMTAIARDGALDLSVSGVAYSYVQLNDRPIYNEKAVAMIDLAAIKGAVTLQAVCYDQDGQIARYVDLMDSIESPGAYEVALRVYRTPLDGTQRISFKIWLAGNEPTAKVAALAYGMTK